MRLPTINEKIILRNLKANDVNNLYAWTNNTEIAKYFRFTRVPFSREKSREFLQSQLNGDPNNIHLAIEEIEAKEFVGLVSLKNINWIDRNSEFAIVLFSKDKMGRGYGKAATIAIVKYGFDALNLNRIYLSVLSTNKRAQYLYEKIGFKKEGAWRRHVYLMGEYQDLFWYGLNKGELKPNSKDRNNLRTP